MPEATPAGYLPITQLAKAIAAHRAELGESACVAFVVHPGGAAGAYQAGALQALGGYGLHPDLVIGTSAGALNGLGFLLDELVPPSPQGPWPRSRLGRLWRHLSHHQQGSALLLDKPCIVGWMSGRPDWNRQMIGGLAGHLAHLGNEMAALRDGLFTADKLRTFLAGTITKALNADAEPDADDAGNRVVLAWELANQTGVKPPTLISVATDVATHRPAAFVLGDPEVAKLLAQRHWVSHLLGQGQFKGRAVLEALIASCSIPGVFPAVKLPSDSQGNLHPHVDGAVANAEPFHLAIDAGATLIVSLEIEPTDRPTVYAPKVANHFITATTESFMAVQDRYQQIDARGVSRWNRRLVSGRGAGRLVVPFYRLAPLKREIGLLEFDGRYDDGELAFSLFDWYMCGYGDAGGGHAAAWTHYSQSLKAHGDTGQALTPRPHPGFWDATYLAAPTPTYLKRALTPEH